MDNGFSFGDKATWDFPIMRVERYPSASGAVRQYKTFSVPGRNGDLHFDERAFRNCTQSYDVYFHASGLANVEAHDVKAWLLGTAGYQRLVDVYDPSHYRMAMVTGEIDIRNHFDRYGKFTVSFDCDPRAFLLSGDAPVEFSAPGDLENPTVYPALPLISVTGSGPGTVSVNGITIQIKKLSGTIFLDGENENAYSMQGEAPVNENSSIYAPRFPELAPGKNGIAFSGGVESITITPRWWEI